MAPAGMSKGTGTADVMEKNDGGCQEESDVDFEIRPAISDVHTNNNRSTWTNGQCVAAIPTRSMFNPRFDLSLCRAKLERNGFEIPVSDMEIPLKIALDVPSVRRYMVFNSGLFHFLMAPVLYVVLWCAGFSTLHLYITVTDYWVLILSVSLIAILLTTAIIFILHHSNKKININIDVRLVQVNERMMKHKLLVAVADWVQNCTGHMQLYFVYWDMSSCLRTLSDTLEELSFVADDTQKTMKSRMSHLVLVMEVPPIDPEAAVSEVEQDCDENKPLLRNEDTRSSTPSSQQGAPKVTSNYSLVPEALLPAQAKAYQLLMTYSAAYVKLLVSERLSGPTHHHLRPLRNHCTMAPLCLCQYVKKKILQ
ncbi:PREDICTED: transmembrane protein C9orf91 homolog isoform X1 [Cyprinodon variegatus]|uniref:Transmembrane protein 268 n=2 Tax=Cyprinodon variegatus TaxID=28743 RepID=A0A3Q2CAN2_CYPVA|nr:PREDICTED: transmembrane protein C9orf91 homolog isoform X1 [Cyprinodon variegatus]